MTALFHMLCTLYTVEDQIQILVLHSEFLIRCLIITFEFFTKSEIIITQMCLENGSNPGIRAAVSRSLAVISEYSRSIGCLHKIKAVA